MAGSAIQVWKDAFAAENQNREKTLHARDFIIEAQISAILSR